MHPLTCLHACLPAETCPTIVVTHDTSVRRVSVSVFRDDVSQFCFARSRPLPLQICQGIIHLSRLGQYSAMLAWQFAVACGRRAWCINWCFCSLRPLSQLLHRLVSRRAAAHAIRISSGRLPPLPHRILHRPRFHSANKYLLPSIPYAWRWLLSR